MEITPEFSYTAHLKPPVLIGQGPFGTRAFFEVTGGRVEGERIRGEILTGGGDWAILGPDGWGRLDVRAQIRTQDGAVIYLHYFGLMEVTPQVEAALAGHGGTDFGEHYFRTAPRLETGDPRYAWVNQSLFVAEGRVLPGPAVEYRVYRVG